jgi:hypothetical protein
MPLPYLQHQRAMVLRMAAQEAIQETLQPKVPRRVAGVDRGVLDVAVAVQALGGARLRDDGVRREDPPQGRIVVLGIVVVQPRLGVLLLVDVAVLCDSSTPGGRRGLPVGRYVRRWTSPPWASGRTARLPRWSPCT